MTEGAYIDAAGVRTHVIALGEGGTPLVMLHGVLSEGASWEGVAPQLATGRKVVCPDLPLHGRTETPADFDPDPDGLVQWLEALLDDLGAEEADLCGLSLGGAVALHYSLVRSERVRRMVLVDAANVVDLDEGYRQFISEMREKLEGAIGVGVTTSRQCWTEEFGFEGARTAAVDLCADPIVMSVLDYLEQRGIPFEQVMHGLKFLEPIPPERIAQVQVPTMAIWGSDDPFFPADQAVPVLEAIPGVRIEVMEGVGHNPAHERPDRFVRLVEGFLG
ncbi:MAG: alpha/beta hydrolase [Thermoplasmata archaeon]|nr:MAG: alpha/beta hydrolase [Thermoplasmata archaeon]